MSDLLTATIYRSLVRRPAFVVGPGRSGTTALLSALGKHPLILGGFGEAPVVAQLGEVAGALTMGEKVDYYQRSLRVPRSHFYRRLRILCFEAAVGGKSGWALARSQLSRGGSVLRRPRVWTVKTFPSEVSAEGLTRLFPSVRFILIVRSGLEVVHSRTRFPGFSGNDFPEQCRVWVRSIERFRHLIGRPDTLMVRHETLVSNPCEFFRSTLEFLQLPHHDSCAEYCATTLVHPLDRSTREGVDVRQELEERAPGHMNWTAEQRSTFRDSCGEAMKLLGYELPGI